MSIRIALAGNPNCGKTTLFNALTGSNQYVGNWPGVTVEKKEGKLKTHKDVTIIDLPGIYSLSPYTMEEVIARNFLIDERPDVIINIIDGTNLERNLYLTTQLVELGIPVMLAVNMMDSVKKSGSEIKFAQLAKEIGCEAVGISALKGDGITELADKAVKLGESGKKTVAQHHFEQKVEDAVNQIEALLTDAPAEQKRWFAIKVFENDEKAIDRLKLSTSTLAKAKEISDAVCKELDDDAESVITNERYTYIISIIDKCYKNTNKGKETTSDKIDKIVTNRFLALPIFAVVIFLVYYISVTTVGTWGTDWANDGVFGDGWFLGPGASAYEEATGEYDTAQSVIEAYESGEMKYDVYDDNGNVEEEVDVDEAMYNDALTVEEPDPSSFGIWVPGIPVLVEGVLTSLNCADWLSDLILNGIVAGVGAVLGFVPQMLVLFFLLAILESCGYMARIAFVLDRVFRRFGLSGKSFIPMLIGTGCGVPGVMASRTIENESDRRMTIMTTTFIPCGAKLPIIALIAGALFDGAWWVAPSSYFVGIMAIIVSGIMLKKTKPFAGEPAPFVMELPAYHVPTLGNVLRSMWERGWSFIKKAGTVILFATILVWFTSGYGFTDGGFGAVDMDNSILANIGNAIAILFKPLGWGNWKAAVAAVTGLIAKENVVGTFGVLYGGFDEVAENGWEIWNNLREAYTPAAGYSFLVFNLLCAPCFAAIGAIKREMNNGKWTAFAITYQCVFAYLVAFMIYQFSGIFTGSVNIIGVVLAAVVLVGMLYMLFRPYKKAE